MPAAHGRSSAVFLNAYNVSAFLSSFDSTKTVDTAEVTTFGSTSKSYVTGLRDGTITLGGYFDGGAGALDEIMTMMLSDTQVSYGTDLFPTSGNQVADWTTVNNVVNASTPIPGFAGSIQFSDATIARNVQRAVVQTIGLSYVNSFFIRMDDGSLPISNGANRDFSLVGDGQDLSCTLLRVDSTTYLVQGRYVKLSANLTSGIFKAIGYSAKPFKIAGFSVNEITTTTAPNPILSICEDGAGTIGNRCTVAQVIDTSYQITGSISDAVQVTAEFQADGTGVSGAYRGVVLAPLAAYSNGQNTTGFDGGAASSTGLVANLHVLSAGGSTTVKIQHSTDNSSWTDLITFTTGAVQFCEHKTTTGTVHRYLRVNVVTDGLPVMVVTAARK